MNGHTQGPWSVSDLSGEVRDAGGQPLVVPAVDAWVGRAEERRITLTLIASAPDHAMIASVLCSGAARWEPFPSGGGGEFCIDGIRHATFMDQFGVPAMTHGMRAAIVKATGENP